VGKNKGVVEMIVRGGARSGGVDQILVHMRCACGKPTTAVAHKHCKECHIEKKRRKLCKKQMATEQTA